MKQSTVTYTDIKDWARAIEKILAHERSKLKGKRTRLPDKGGEPHQEG